MVTLAPATNFDHFWHTFSNQQHCYYIILAFPYYLKFYQIIFRNFLQMTYQVRHQSLRPFLGMTHRVCYQTL